MDFREILLSSLVLLSICFIGFQLRRDKSVPPGGNILVSWGFPPVKIILAYLQFISSSHFTIYLTFGEKRGPLERLRHVPISSF